MRSHKLDGVALLLLPGFGFGVRTQGFDGLAVAFDVVAGYLHHFAEETVYGVAHRVNSDAGAEQNGGPGGVALTT